VSDPGALEVQRLDSLDQVREHAAAWETLLERDPHATLFQSPEMFITWQEVAGQADRPFVLLVRRDHELVGVAPLVIRRRAASRVGARRLELGVPRGDFVIPGERAAVVEALVRGWKAASAEWDQVVLEEVPDAPGTLAAVEAAARYQGLESRRAGPGKSESYLPTAGGWEAYLARRSHDFRRRLRRATLAVERLGETRLRICRDPTSLAGALEELFALEQQSWKAAGGARVPEAERRWYRELARRPARTLRLELGFLDLAGRAIAGLIWIVHRDRLYAFITFYDERFSTASPGLWLLRRLIEESFRRDGIAEVSFVGTHEAARTWTPLTRGAQGLRLYNRRPLSRVLALRDRLRRPRVAAAAGPRSAWCPPPVAPSAGKP